MRTLYGILALLLWVLTCGAVFKVVDAVATRPVAVYIEDYRRPGTTDDDALVAALQAARRRGDNWWWIRDSQAVILLDEARDYRLDPSLLRLVDVPVVKQRAHEAVPFLSSIPAVKIP